MFFAARFLYQNPKERTMTKYAMTMEKSMAFMDQPLWKSLEGCRAVDCQEVIIDVWFGELKDLDSECCYLDHRLPERGLLRETMAMRDVVRAYQESSSKARVGRLVLPFSSFR